MAKALFHKNQRVFVRPVGTWAVIERVVPQWVKDVPEPLRVFYDVGLGRDFLATELQTEESTTLTNVDPTMEQWQVVRAQNKWRSAEECSSHPYPGTYPIIVTGTQEGGWRVPGTEYDFNPERIELQARIMASGPVFMGLLRRLVDYAMSNPENLPDQLMEVARDAETALDRVKVIDPA
tara:strand:+ start:152957 stop:153493 length:537 start_codon:yes stop_codon:yes gene_type:complete